MKSLIIYDSNYGNTKLIAETIGKELGSTVVSVDEFKEAMLNDISLLIVGSPIIGWRPTEKTSNILSKMIKYGINGIKVTTFDTRVKLFIHGDAMQKMLNELIKAGASSLVKPEPFYVKGKEGILLDGEIEKAKIWAQKIKKVR